MKRALSLILVFSLLLSGCSFLGERIKDPVFFYYVCSNYQEDLCCVIVSEQRESSGHIGDLSYLLALYSMGPISDEIVSPLPPDVQITAKRDNDHVYLELSNPEAPMSDIDFSLACACLTLTCLDITGAQDVTIRHGERTKTLQRSDVTLYDVTAETIPTEESK